MRIHSLIPSSIRHSLRPLLNPYRLFMTKAYLAHLLQKKSIKVLIGHGGTSYPGWLVTDKDTLDLLRESDWARYFQPSSVDAMLAEHVWEHLSAVEGLLAAKTCFWYLKPGGYLRAAVPDGLHPDPGYIESVRIGGTGSGADDHKILYTYSIFREVFTSVGFEVFLHEYFDENGHFHFKEWTSSDGMISRSKRYDYRNWRSPRIYIHYPLCQEANNTLIPSSSILDPRYFLAVMKP